MSDSIPFSHDGLLFEADDELVGFAVPFLAYQELVERELARGATRVRVVSEVNFGGTPHAITESVRFEAAANAALSQHPLWNVCLYDLRRTPDELRATSEHAHRHLVNGQSRQPNPAYLPPRELLRRHSQTTPFPIEARMPTVVVDNVRSPIRDWASTTPWPGSCPCRSTPCPRVAWGSGSRETSRTRWTSRRPPRGSPPASRPGSPSSRRN